MKSAARFTAPAAVLLLALTGCSADQGGGDAPSPAAAQSTETQSTTETQSAEPSSPTGSSEGRLNADGDWRTDQPFLSTTEGLWPKDNIFPNGVRVGFVDEAPDFIKKSFKAAGMEVPSNAQFIYLETVVGEGLSKDIYNVNAHVSDGDYTEYETIPSWFTNLAEHSGAPTPSGDPENSPSDATRLARDDGGIEATAGSGGTAKLYFVVDSNEKNPDWVSNVFLKIASHEDGLSDSSLRLIPGKQAVVPEDD